MCEVGGEPEVLNLVEVVLQAVDSLICEVGRRAGSVEPCGGGIASCCGRGAGIAYWEGSWHCILGGELALHTGRGAGSALIGITSCGT